jgi:hypothetical protein
MTLNSAPPAVQARSGALAIVVGGLTAGVLDLTWACIGSGWWPTPLGVAGGLLGRQVIHTGGVSIWLMGVFLHFFIAFSFATCYYVASRKLVVLTEHPLVCGLAYGAAVEVFMTFVVLPLSALHIKSHFSLHYLLTGLWSHMILIGLPISLSARWFSKSGRAPIHAAR